jgi:hypothetical protein
MTRPVHKGHTGSDGWLLTLTVSTSKGPGLEGFVPIPVATGVPLCRGLPRHGMLVLTCAVPHVAAGRGVREAQGAAAGTRGAAGVLHNVQHAGCCCANTLARLASNT